MTTTTTLVKLLHQARTQLQSKWKIWTPASPLSQTKAVVGAPWAQCARAQSTWTVTVVPPSSSVPICRIARTVHQRINQPFSLGGIGQAQSKRDCTQPSQVAARSFSTKNYKLKSYSSYRKRFRVIGKKSSGEYKRSRCGNAHLAFGKRLSRKRRLRQNTTTFAGYARVMKKLGFKSK